MSSNYSYISNADGAYVDSLYQQFQQDPESVDSGWRQFFEGFEFARINYGEEPETVPSAFKKEFQVIDLINAYRNRGHLFTKTNPVRERRKYSPTLDIENFGLSKEDLSTVFQAATELNLPPSSLKDIIAMLEQTYCQSVGVEYTYGRFEKEVKWLTSKMESSRNKPKFTLDEKKHILDKLNRAVAFETFLGSKYVGQKRFSLEGAETLIPALDEIFKRGATLGVEEYVIGMAHRGRLNVLANILGKTYEEIFSEFEEFITTEGSFEGDVKYHLGYACDVLLENGKTVHLSLSPNPSHLEAVAPVALGNSRAKIDQKYEHDPSKLTPIVIHGDASIAGQGVVYEVIQMSGLEAYTTGGSIHIVINNQVGFTTNYIDGRTSVYCTDAAKVTQSPVFHVNGDDVEAVVYCSQLAMEYRQQFGKDVFIDLLCYRRHGHNEGDEPRFTQPELYSVIEKHPNPRGIYFDKLLAMGEVEQTLAKSMEKDFKRFLQARLNDVKQKKTHSVEYGFQQSAWKNHIIDIEEHYVNEPDTAVSEKKFRALADSMTTLPEGKAFYSKMVKIIDQRKKMIKEDRLDWAMGELMAYATLLDEGFNVRMSGQDCERGTFAHRHAIMRYDGINEYIPLNHLTDKQGRFEVYNSFLSEYAVLGFEYGYSWSSPKNMVIWEAQFGDFANGAQIIIDQFISSALTKWKRLSGLVMLLPHGFEGQGPEHSSARMERFLELCAGNNMQVVQPTTPASMFHLLRRQLHGLIQTPLIVMTPKSLLRHPAAVNPVKDFTNEKFQEVLDDPSIKDAKKVKRVVFCTGKLYYDLSKKQAELNSTDIALVRLEQIYPLPVSELNTVIKKYSAAKSWVWAQEEPENMGAWPFILRKFTMVPLERISRKENSSPATGYKKQHQNQQNYIIDRVFVVEKEKKKTSAALVK